MSIVCTLEPNVNLFKSGAATKNVLLLKNNNTVKSSTSASVTTPTQTISSPLSTSLSAATASPTVVIKNYNNLSNGNHLSGNHSILLTKEKNSIASIKHSSNKEIAQTQQQQVRNQEYCKTRISVADFVVRHHHNIGEQQQLNSELLNHQQYHQLQQQQHNSLIVTAMPPEVLNITNTTTTLNNNNNNKNITNNHHHHNNNNNTNNKLSTPSALKINSTTPTITTSSSMNNARMSSVSPSLSMNGSSNEATNVHALSMYGPMSPQSSDSGHSMSDTPHMKFGGNFNGYEGSGNMSKQSNHHKELFTQRKQREFTPDNKKDDSYWDRRRRNNEAAKRSREKRRYNDMVLEQRVVELTKENHVLKAQLDAIRDKFNISGENLVSVEQILASLPTSEQVLSITKRAKITPSNGNSGAVNGSGGGGGGFGGVTPPSNGYVASTTAGSTSSGAGVVATSTPLAIQQKQQTILTSSSAGPAGVIVGNESVSQQSSPQHQHVIKSVSHVTSHLGTPLPPHPHAISPVVHQPHLPQHVTSHHHMPQHPVQHQQHYQQAENYATELTTRPNSVGHATNLSNSVSTTSVQLESNGRQVANGTLQSAQPPALSNLHVLQALNRNVSCDDLDKIRKVVAVVGAMTTNNVGVAASGELPPSMNALYGPTGQTPLPLHHHHYVTQAPAGVYSPNIDVKYMQASPEPTVSSSAVDAVSSSSPGAASVLNLSRRACTTPTYEHMLSSTTSSRLSSCLSSSGSSSGAVSGDDEHEPDAVDEVHHHHSVVVNGNSSSPSSNDSNNCLPLKLRHKSHLGDKDAAATALLALQHIKQEPVSHRSSPPAWNDGGDNSSDERDSGISIGSAEWISQCKRKVLAPTSLENAQSAAVDSLDREHSLKSKLARLESEVATIKNMMILSADQNTVAPV